MSINCLQRLEIGDVLLLLSLTIVTWEKKSFNPQQQLSILKSPVPHPKTVIWLSLSDIVYFLSSFGQSLNLSFLCSVFLSSNKKGKKEKRRYFCLSRNTFAPLKFCVEQLKFLLDNFYFRTNRTELYLKQSK